MKNAIYRLISVLQICRHLEIPVTISVDVPKFALAAFDANDGVYVSHSFMRRKATSRNVDILTFSLLHELGHVAIDATNLYPDMKRLSKQKFRGKSDARRYLDTIKDFQAKHMHIEHYADAFAIDLALKLGLPNPMELTGYL